MAILAATSEGYDSGLSALRALAVSGDGESIYTVSDLDDALARFDRNPRTGALTYKGCVSGRTRIGLFGRVR